MFCRILCAVFFLLLPGLAHAQKTPAQLQTEISTNFPDNSINAITPALLRAPISDIVSSIMPAVAPVSGNVACFNGTTGLLQDCGKAPSNFIQSITGDCTASSSGVITCTKTNGTVFGPFATATSITITPFAISAAKTSNYPIVSSDCNSTVVMGTGSTAQLTVTLPSLPTTGFGAGCTVYVKNNNIYSGIGTGHAMTMAAFPSDLFALLYPQQTVAVQVNAAGTAWITIRNPGRWKIPTSAEICVAQNGNDANDGLGSGTGCMQTPQQAAVVIGSQWDGGGYNSCSLGFYAGGTSILSSANQTGQSIGCFITINIRGAITWASTGPCWTGGDNSITIINWNLGFMPTFKCNSANTASTGQLKCHQYCVFDINGGTGVWLPSGSNDVFFDLDLQGSATFNATLNVGDGVNTYTPASFIQCEAHCSKVTVSGSLAFSPLVTMDHVYTLRSGSVMSVGATYPGVTATNPTVPTGGSIFITNGTTIPGGTTSGTLNGLVCTSTPC